MMETDFQLLYYFGMWQQVVCLFAFLGLMAIWYHIGRKQKDFGQVWLALSLLCWSISGYVDSLYGSKLISSSQLISVMDQTELDRHLLFLNGSKSILSLLNSLFILLALPWFRHLPAILEHVIKSKYWPVIIGLPFIFSILPTFSKIYTNSSMGLISELDVYYSILTLSVLGLVLWESFTKRRLTFLAVLSVICIMITFAAQLFKLTSDANSQILFSAIFKTSLIMIFFALALSWVKDLTERIQYKSSDLYIKLAKIKNGRSILKTMTIKGLLDDAKEFTLTNKNYNLLETFVLKKQSADNGWLEIKPKSDKRSGIIYDINDHNEIKRLLHAILDGVYGKDAWSKSEHELPLKEIMFEMSKEKERMIRLAIPVDNLEV